MKKTINIGIVAHVDAGKTTLTENLLYKSGAIKRKGKVDCADTVTDNLELEKKRGITIKETTVSFYWGKCKINILDTPGHSDFYSEVIRSLQVLDIAILVISAKEGVQSQTINIYQALRKCNVPVLFFINKIDRMGADILRVESEIDKILGTTYLNMQKLKHDILNNIYNLVPWEKDSILFEENILKVSIFNEQILDEYIENDYVKKDEIYGAIRKLFWENKLSPIYYGSAINEIGISELLDGIVMLSREEKQAVSAFDNEPLSAYVYKISIDEKRNRRVFFRVYSGSIKLRQRVTIIGKQKEVIIRNMDKLENGNVVQALYIEKDDIGILTNEFTMQVGDVIGMKLDRFLKPESVKPILTTSIVPLNGQDRSRMITALYCMNEENPDMNFHIDSVTSEAKVNVLGEIQLEFILYQLEVRYKIKAHAENMRTIYKETVSQKGTAQILMGEEGNPFAASISLAVEPLEQGRGVNYLSNVSYGYLTKSFQLAVRDGIMKGVKEGTSGREITDVQIIFNGAYYDSVSSTPADFRNLAPYVLEKVLKIAGTEILIPIVEFEISLPNGNCGKVICDIEKMGGQLNTMVVAGEIQYLRGELPFDNCKMYGIQLASDTQGKGLFTVTSVKYAKRIVR